MFLARSAPVGYYPTTVGLSQILKDLVRNPLYKIMIFADLGVTKFQFFASNFVIMALFSLESLLYDAHRPCAPVETNPRSKLDLESKINRYYEFHFVFKKN